MWNPKKFKKVLSLEDRNFILTSGSLAEAGTILNVVNVYAPQKVGEKRALWDRLKGVMRGRLGLWIFLGDFNAVRFPEERKNSRFDHASASDLNAFIDDACLQEYVMRGNKFTFLAGKGKGFKLRKLTVF